LEHTEQQENTNVKKVAIIGAAMNRRSMLMAGVALAGSLAVAACSQAQVDQFNADWTSVASAIQQGVAEAAQYIPTVESIVSTAAGLFGPQYEALVQIGTAAFNQVVSTLINLVNNLSPPASARLRARLRGSSPRTPIAIGTVTTPNGVVNVVGWQK
jgi:hypothetical protein